MPFPRRRFKPAIEGIWVGGALLIALVAIRLSCSFLGNQPPETLTEGSYVVERVIDGDTLLLANGARIRLIGVDTPETVRPHTAVQPFGPEATAFTRRFIGERPVGLRFDRERLDRHGRYLAYVYVEDRMLNEELVRAGLARAEWNFHYSDSVKRRYREAQREAQLAGRGLWSQPIHAHDDNEQTPEDEDHERRP